MTALRILLIVIAAVFSPGLAWVVSMMGAGS